MLNSKIKFILLGGVLSLVVSCGTTPKSRIYEKQNTSSDIKINHLNLTTKSLDLRFEYRSYREKSLNTIKCEISFISESELKLQKSFDRKLDTFSTEIISFNNINITHPKNLNNLESINYTIECSIDYDKGNEYLVHDSVLHLVPGKAQTYR